MDTQERDWFSKDESAAKKQNGIMLEVKFKLNINGVINKIGNCQNVDTAVIQETLVMYPVNKHVLNLQILYH